MSAPARAVASLDVEIPASHAAGAPPEARGLERDEVRLMVSSASADTITHARFRDFPELLDREDVVVVNASATITAALDAWRVADGGRVLERVGLHLSSPVPGGGDESWVVELRRLTPDGTAPLFTAARGDRLRLAGGATATLVEPFRPGPRTSQVTDRVRLWVAELLFPGGVLAYAAAHGSPIRYAYVRERWPLDAYQTVFASEPGSAEMPSAGRAFTHAIVSRLERKGVGVVPVVLHTGVASLESGELPYPERYRVTPAAAQAVNEARAAGGRVIAVGTTVVRALETVASVDGQLRPGAGWTDLVVTPERGLYATDAIVTGLHEPRSSHLSMLEAFAGRSHLEAAYRAALERGYLWHEFGDVHFLEGRGSRV